MWKNKPRILTYTNPREIDENRDLIKIISSYPHLCASDTLLMGLTHKYSRAKFTFLTTVDAFIDNLFDQIVNNKEIALQMYIDITKSIEGIKSKERESTYKALMNNRGDLVEAFRILTLMQYNWQNETEHDEQNMFFKYIYEPNAKRYVDEYKRQMSLATKSKCCLAFQKCLIRDIRHNTKIDENKWEDINKKIIAMANYGNKEAELYKNIMDASDNYPIDTIVIHGVARFTPEIMMLLKTLDDIGIKVIFLINYASGLPGIYNFWKKAYSWVGVEFEYVDSLNLDQGNTVGKNIAKICNGIRPEGKAHAEIVKYATITDFTDSAVRTEFLKAERKAKEKNTENILAQMKTQYYAVAADRPNDILRNYFPEQFIDKPFLSYPIGQFIKALFAMWDFEKMELAIDFDVLKECAVIRIGHNNDKMIQIVDKLKLYFKDMMQVEEINKRISELSFNLNTFNEYAKRVLAYLSYFSVSVEEIEEFRIYISELDKISRAIFGNDREKQYDYREKFQELIEIVQSNAAVDDALSLKEDELISKLIESLSISSEHEVVGSIKELRDSLYFFLSVKKDKSSANWIVRGFDQIDGAPLMKMPVGRIYEFAMMSMKNMTKTASDILPWPLDESVFNEIVGQSIFLEQMRNIVELRNEYLRFYFFYGAFFSKGAQIKFSYIENDHEERQHPYYLLDLLGIPTITNVEKNSITNYDVIDEEDETELIRNQVSIRERELFSICPYKYFMISVLKNDLYYTSEYHTNYFLENEVVNLVEIESNYDIRNIDNALRRIKQYIKKICPYIDEATLSDMERFVRKNFSNKKRGEDFLRRKRDFLIAAWKDMDTNVNYMKFDKAETDIVRYMKSNRLAPISTECPHTKICEECNYNELCLNYYLDKEVDE